MQGMRISFRLPWGMPEKPVPPYAEWRAGTKLIGFYTLMDLFRNVATHFPVRMMPLFLRSYAMRKLWNYK